MYRRYFHRTETIHLPKNSSRTLLNVTAIGTIQRKKSKIKDIQKVSESVSRRIYNIDRSILSERPIVVFSINPAVDYNKVSCVGFFSFFSSPPPIADSQKSNDFFVSFISWHGDFVLRQRVNAAIIDWAIVRKENIARSAQR